MKKQSLISLLIYLIIFALSANAAPPAADIIVIDNVRNLQITENTTITVDGKLKALEQFGSGLAPQASLSGYKARVSYTASNSANGGDLSEINLLNSVLGPVTSNDDYGLHVLMESVPTNGEITLVGIDDVSELEIGDIVAVSGLELPYGGVQVTRIEYLADGSDYWLVTGNISSILQDGFYIRNQFIHTNASTELECGAESLEYDLKVTIEVTPIEKYAYSDDLHAERITCYEDFNPPPPVEQPPAILISGSIESINESQSQMVVDGYTINLNDATEITSRNGSTNLEVDMDVTVSGSEIPQTGEILADSVYILEAGGPDPVHLSGEIVTVNEAQTEFTMTGANGVNATVMTSPVTNFINGTQMDLVVGTLIDVTGAEDTNTGSVIAEAVFFRPDAPSPYVFFSGFITNVASSGSQITVDNQIVNITGNTQIVGGTIDDLLLDVEVTVSGAYDDATEEVDALSITIGQNGNGNGKSLRAAPLKNANGPINGSGIITRVIEDMIFKGTF